MTQTNDEISQCLDQILKDQDIVQSEIELTDVVTKGTNFVGKIRRARIGGRDRNGKPVDLRLVIKIAPSSSLLRAAMAVEQSYRCEIFMYRTAFENYAHIHVPRFFAASENVLVLEDVAPLRSLSSTTTLNYAQALLLVREIGRFHAASLVHRKKNPELLRVISRGIRCDNLDVAWLITECLAAWIPDALKLLDAESRRRFDGFFRKFRVYFDRFYEFDADDPYGVVGHCDLWPCNLLYDDEGNPQKMCIVDWQTARLCSPGVDLSMILFLCCDDAVRRIHGEDLVKAYYASCTQWMAAHGEEVSELLPFDVLQTHLKFYGGYAVCLALRTITVVSVPNDVIPNPTSANTKEEYVDLWKTVKKNPQVYDSRTRSLFLDFLRSGYDILD